MKRRAKILVMIGGVVFACLMVEVFYRKEIRVAYHRHRLFVAMDNYGLLCWQPVRSATKLEALRILTFRMTAQKELEAVECHKEALLRLGYFATREFVATNQNLKGNWLILRAKATNTFAQNQWWSIPLLETNRIAVVATPTYLQRWERLISEFDC